MTEEAEQQEMSLRDTIEAAAEAAKPQEIVTEDKTAEASVEEPKPEGRDEKGRFKAKEEAAEQLAVQQYKVPNSWSAPVKEKFSILPPEVQAEIARREEEVEKGFTRLDEERNFGKALKEVITPYMPIITAEGGTPAAAVRDLLNTAYQLRTGTPQQKAALVQQIAQQYGVDLGTLRPGEQTYVDPHVMTLQQKIDALERERATEKQLQVQQEQSKVLNEIQAFAADPKNVHFEQVRAHMASLLNSGAAKDLQEAYEQAIWANPEVRSKLMSQQQVETEVKRKQELEAKKKAASSVTGSPGVIVPNSGNPNRNLREEITANLRAVTSS